MHQIRFPLGLGPRPRWGSSQRSPRPLAAGFKGPTSKGEEGKGRVGKGEERNERKKNPPFKMSAYGPEFAACFSAELLTVILCRLLVNAITHLV